MLQSVDDDVVNDAVRHMSGIFTDRTGVRVTAGRRGGISTDHRGTPPKETGPVIF